MIVFMEFYRFLMIFVSFHYYFGLNIMICNLCMRKVLDQDPDPHSQPAWIRIHQICWIRIRTLVNIQVTRGAVAWDMDGLQISSVPVNLMYRDMSANLFDPVPRIVEMGSLLAKEGLAFRNSKR